MEKNINDLNIDNIDHYPILKRPPEVGDIIYVPSYEIDLKKQFSIENCKKIGGAAKISRVIRDGNGYNYITVEEYSGYFEMCWEKDLMHLQEELSKKFGLNRAYIDF